MWSAGPGDDQARFLADLRTLRDMAAIGYDELAARAHYPSDILKEAENGPLMPGLPVLTAYVRACDGDVLDWEERWRRLASEVPEDPGLPIRPPGASPAAVAGARAGVGVTPPDVYDPERIRAALRGGQGRSDQGRGSGDRSFPARGSEFTDLKLSPAGWGADTGQETGVRRGAEASLEVGTNREAGAGWNTHPSWDAAADQTISMTNGNHSARNGSRGPFDAAVVEMPDPAERTDHTDQFRWLPDTSSMSEPVDTEFAWPDEANAGLAAPEAENDITATEPTAGEWAAPWHQDSAPKPSERSDFWATPATAASADLQLPAAPPHRTQEQPYPPASWSAFPETTHTSDAPAVSELPHQPAIDTVRSAKATQSPTSAERAGSTGSARTAATEPASHQKDRFFPVRLLVIIVIAALIGSALVLLLR